MVQSHISSVISALECIPVQPCIRKKITAKTKLMISTKTSNWLFLPRIPRHHQMTGIWLIVFPALVWPWGCFRTWRCWLDWPAHLWKQLVPLDPMT